MNTIEEFNKYILRDNSLNLKIEYANEYKIFVNIFLNGDNVAQFNMGVGENSNKPELRLLHSNQLFYLYLKKDKLFQEKWDKQVKHLIIKQCNKCNNCKKTFDSHTKKVLHHIDFEIKLKEISDKGDKIVKNILEKKITLDKGIQKHISIINKYIHYYKSLKDTILVCFDCHNHIHKIGE